MNGLAPPRQWSPKEQEVLAIFYNDSTEDLKEENARKEEKFQNVVKGPSWDHH